MTNEQVRDEMSHEIGVWFAVNRMVPLSADEALLEYHDSLTIYQRSYLMAFIARWEAWEGD